MGRARAGFWERSKGAIIILLLVCTVLALMALMAKVAFSDEVRVRVTVPSAIRVVGGSARCGAERVSPVVGRGLVSYVSP